MEIWIDSCDVNEIQKASAFGFIYGITTNPTLLANGNKDYKEILKELLDCQKGQVAVQVTSDNASEMFKEGIDLHKLSDRIIVKVPVIKEGLIALNQLSKAGVPLIATTIYTSNQALLAALAGADYIAPYISRMGKDPHSIINLLENIKKTYTHYNFKTKILAASIKTIEEVNSMSLIGLEALTLNIDLFNEFIKDNPLTIKAIEIFSENWNNRIHK